MEGESEEQRPMVEEVSQKHEDVILVDILKTYYELCRRSDDKSELIQDASLQKTLVDYLLDTRPKVLLYVCKILLTLTDSASDAAALAQNAQLKSNIWSACERNVQPKVTRNLLRVNSRMAPQRQAAPRRTFINRASSDKQHVFVFDELTEEHKRRVEANCVSAPGVVSICFQDNKCVLRCKENVEGKDIAKRLLSCGFDAVSMIVKLEDGSQDTFDFYAENQLDRSSEIREREEKLPRYLDDYADEFDPKSCIVSEEQLMKEKQGGSWFSALRFW